MTDDLTLGRKWTLRAHGRQMVFVKRPVESREHVLMKAFLWALYLPEYPDLQVEVRIGHRYKPDVVSLPQDNTSPLFWGEAGHVGVAKMRTLLRRFPTTHFAFARWGETLHTLRTFVASALQEEKRRAPVDLICLPPDAAERFINERGEISVILPDLDWARL